MKTIYNYLALVLVLFCVSVKAQPVLGTTDFAVNGTISWNTNSPCVATKTADVQGWLVSVNSTSNCGINQSNSGGGDGRLQYLVGFGTLTQASFGTDDGSEFALLNLAWGASTSSFTSKSINFVGYRNGMPVPGATLNAITGPTSGPTFTTIVNFAGNLNFANVDNVLVIPTETCSSILFFDDITIGSPSLCIVSPTITVNGSGNVKCNGGATGSATVTATGNGPFSYVWSPSGGNAATATNLSAGIYTVAVTNSCNITAYQTVTITQPSALVTSTAVTNVACNGGSNGVASITASGGAGSYTYLWSNGGSTSAITGLLAGAYTATVTDANSCISIKNAIVTQPSALVTSTAVTNVSCNGGSNGTATITASGGAGGYTYLWSTGNSSSAITGRMAGAYTATVTDANSCTSIKSAIITQPSALVTTTAVTNVACNGGSNGSATITASGGVGGYTYLWSNGASTSAISGLLAGVYSATVTDANSCTSIKSAVVTQPSALATTTAVTNVACNGGANGSATITASGGVGGYTYLWSNGATTSAISGLLAGAYSATVTDANSCTSIKSAVVTQPSALATTTAVTNVACNGGSNGVASITASGGAGSYTYLWSNGATTSAITGMMAGAYSATVTDANSCTSTKSAVITQPSALATTTAVTNVACNGGSNGVASITASGGAGSYTYLWSNGATTSAITGMMAGAYSATVTDANSCTSIKSAVITQPSALATTTAVTNVACNGGSNGSATITASGGAGSYTYLWSNGATTSAITGMMAGAYSATVTDANSCTSIKNAVVTQPSALATTTAVTNVACNGGSNGSATITASGGAGSYTYLWSNGATTSAITGMMAGAYSATVTDANSCTSIKSAVVTQPSAIITSTAVNNALCNAGTGSATIIATGGAGSYTYLWSNGATTSAVSGLLAGAYSATVTDANSCTSNKSVNISQPATALTSTVTTTGVLCHGGSTGSATISASGGTGAITYNWSNGTAASSISNVAAGIYTVTATDANSCTSVKTVTITEPTSLTLTAVSSATGICPGQSATLTASTSGGNGPSTYTWVSGPSSNTYAVSPSVTTIYTVNANDANNCQTSQTVSLVVYALPTITVNSPSICAGNSVVIAHSGASTYTITGGSFTVSPLTNTSYSVTGSSIEGCASSNTAVATVAVKTTPTLSVNNATICSGNSAVLTPSASITGVTFSVTGGNFTVSPVSTTSYSVTGISSDGCPASNTAVATVSVNATPTLAVNSATICSGSSVVITPTGASSYTISGGTFTVSPATTTTYVVTGTGANACVSQSVASTVSVNITPTITVNSGATCPGGSFTIAPTGAGSYTVTGGSFVVTPPVTTSYSVTGTGTNNCVASNTAVSTVSIVNNLTISVSGSTNVCNGRATTLTAGGASTYSWSTGIITNTIALSPTANATYSVIGASGSCSASAVVSLSVLTTPTVAVTSTSTCLGSSVVITPSGANSYTITGGTFTVTPSATTDYSITGSNTQGCISLNTAVATVSTIALPTISVNSGSICSGRSFTINPTGANSYTVTGGTLTVTPNTTTAYSVTGTGTNGCVSSTPAVANVTVSATPTITVPNYSVCLGKTVTVVPAGAGTGGTYTITGGSFTLTPTAAANYSVTGTSSAGCVSNTFAVSNVTVFTPPVIAVNSNSAVCSGNSVVIVPSGATSYTITGNTYTVSPSATTAYSVTGTSNGCVSTNTAVFTASVNTSPTISVNSGAICLNNTFVIVPSGANTYTITGGSFSVSPTANTSYTVTGTSTNNCISSVSGIATVTVNALPVVTLNSGAICPGNTFTFFPTGAATYTFSNGSNTVTPAATADYSVTGTSSSGCLSSNTAVATVSVINTVVLNVLGNTAICLGETTTLTATGANSYTWSTSDLTESITVTPVANTDYTVHGVSGNCSNTLVVTVTVNPLPTVSVTGGTICSNQSFTITPTGASTYSYSTGSAVITPTSDVTFTVTGVSAEGCNSSNSAVATVTVNALPAVVATPASATLCTGETGTLNASGANTYLWSTMQTDATISITPSVNTTYTLTGTDANGCSKSVTVTQMVDDCTGISKLSSNMNVSVYPNPNNGGFVVASQGNAEIIVTDLAGQVVHTQKTTDLNTSISIKELANGIYFVKVSNGAAQHTFKIVKQ